MTRRLASLLLLVSLGPLMPVGPAAAFDEPSPPATGADPHGDPSACTACHEPAVGDQAVGPLAPITPTCRTCHPTADMHPVGVAPDEVVVPERFPLDDGLLSCATCHLEPAHEPEVPASTPYHRGGPYPDIEQLCYACHDRGAYTRTDPHHPERVRDPGDPTCAACHTGPPDEGASPERAKLRFPTSESCTTCHEGDVHQGVSSHVGEPLSPEVLATLTSDVPVGGDGTVQCFSCHDVHGVAPGEEPRLERRWTARRPLAEELRANTLRHEWADLVPESARWPGTADDTHPPLLTLPIADGALCRACHGEGP